MSRRLSNTEDAKSLTIVLTESCFNAITKKCKDLKIKRSAYIRTMIEEDLAASKRKEHENSTSAE